MREYLNLMEKILPSKIRSDRTGTGTLSTFGQRLEFDLSQGFPLLSTKFVSFKNIKTELLWMLRGQTNVKYLHEHGNHIWDEWADGSGELGPVYGHQWRSWGSDRGVDQILELETNLQEVPYSRRHILSAWNVSDLPRESWSVKTNVELGFMALAPCHVLAQFYVEDTFFGHRRLSCQLYQRSADYFLGVPYNLASYALLTHLFAAVCGYYPGRFIWIGGDVHIYRNHLEQCREQLRRKPRMARPWLNFLRNTAGPGEPVKVNHSIVDFDLEDIELVGYDPHPAIKAEVSV